MFNNILLVCLGNLCRSPMAAGLFRARLRDYPNITISSAGLRAVIGAPAAPKSQTVMQEIGIDISAHRARQIDNSLVKAADLILVMEKKQKQEIIFIFPYSYGRVHELGEWGGFSIPDPFGESIEEYYECLRLIEEGFEDWQERIIKKG